MKDEFRGNKLLMSDDELRKTMSAYQQELRRNQMKERKVAAWIIKKEGDAFLAENKKKEGVVSLPSRLQYKILKEGQGKKPTANDTVAVKYQGAFIDGKEFDSSGITLRLKIWSTFWSTLYQKHPPKSREIPGSPEKAAFR